jgi:hypothetical protein
MPSGNQRQCLGQAVAESGAKAVEQRLARDAELEAAGRDRGIEPQDQAGGDEEGEKARDDAARHVAAGVHGFLGGERELRDGEEQPDREGQGRERARDAERQQRAVALGQLDGGAVGAGADAERKALELGNRQRGDPEHREAGERRQRHDHGDTEGQFDAPHVQPQNTRPRYMTAITRAASAKPPQPPATRPRFQPE